MKTHLFIFLFLTTFFSFSQNSRTVYMKTGYSKSPSFDTDGVFLSAGSDYAIYKNLKLGFEGNAVLTTDFDKKHLSFLAFSAGLSETFILKEKHNFIIKATAGVGGIQRVSGLHNGSSFGIKLPYGFNAGYSFPIKKSTLGVDFQMIFFGQRRFNNFGIVYTVPF